MQLDTAGNVVLEALLGTEDNLVSLDHHRGREVAGSHRILGEALALDGHLQAAEVLQHHYLTAKQRTGDEGLDAGEHSHRIGLGNGSGVRDVRSQVLERVVRGFLSLV